MNIEEILAKWVLDYFGNADPRTKSYVQQAKDDLLKRLVIDVSIPIPVPVLPPPPSEEIENDISSNQ